MNTVVSVASLASASAIAAPSIEPASSEADPVIELIERHRKLYAAAEAAHSAWQDAEEARTWRPKSQNRSLLPRVKVGEVEDLELVESSGGAGEPTLAIKKTGHFLPVFASSEHGIRKNAPKQLTDAERENWISERLAQLDAQEAKVKRRRQRTKIGELEAAWDAASDLASDAAWDLVTAVPTSVHGAVSRLAYIRSCATPAQEIADDREMINALRDTTEAFLWELAGVAAPASLQAVFESTEDDSSAVAAKSEAVAA